jgi:Flp pilus assembly protein TadG
MFRIFTKDRGGTVTILVALTLPVVIGVVALALEFGHGLMTKVEDQRIADFAAYAGALAYNSLGSTTGMTAAADYVAALNGISPDNVSVGLSPSPSGDGNQAVQVNVSSKNLLLLAPVLGFESSLPVTASSYVEISTLASGCIIALSSSGTGVTLSGGTNISAPGCAVASNTTVSVPCGTKITTKTIDYNSSSAPSEPCSGIVPPSGTASVKFAKTVTADPLASNSGVTSATSHMTTVAGLTSPSAPTVPTGGDISFGYYPTSLTAGGCSGSLSGNTWTLTCPSGGTYKFGNLTLSGGINVNFNTSGSASTTYDFSGSISNTGSTLTFGPGTYNIAQGIYTGGGTTTTFGAGTFNLGANTSSCNGNGTYSICNTGTSLKFSGPSTFVVSSGVYNSGGSTLTFGSGSTNSFQIGASSSGNAIYVGGGSSTAFADALGSSSVFQLVGNLNVASGGGSCMTLSAATQHDINGYFSSAGGTQLGSGIYSVNGYIAFGANGGGDVTCNGTTVGVNGAGVTLVTSGGTASSGSCSGQSFCLAGGYNHVTLTAPTSGATDDLVVVGPISSSKTGGATFAEGASNTSLSGAFYFPNGPIALSGGASVGNGSGQCLEIIGTQISLTGGTAAGSLCFSSGSSNSIVLVQ